MRTGVRVFVRRRPMPASTSRGSRCSMRSPAAALLSSVLRHGAGDTRGAPHCSPASWCPFWASPSSRSISRRRFFVLLVPLFALIAFAFDDLLRWRYAPRWTAAWCASGRSRSPPTPLRLQRLIDDPQVRESFLVLRTPSLPPCTRHRRRPCRHAHRDASNALGNPITAGTRNPNRWRPESLAEALVVDRARPLRFVGSPKGHRSAAPAAVGRLVCRDGEWRVRRGINTTATVATVQVPSGSACTFCRAQACQERTP